MATKSETQRRRLALKQFIQETIAGKERLPGQLLPSVRELAERHQLSLSVVNQILRELADEGVVHMVPRVGTFVGQRHQPVSEYYLLLQHYLPDTPNEWEKNACLQLGFEERISQLGGASLVLQPEQALEMRENGKLPPLAGVFDNAYNPERAQNWHADGSLPHVGFASWMEESAQSDVVSFDDVDGGLQATQYLIRLGHRHIAFLAFPPAGQGRTEYLWSRERKAGWQQAMQEAGLSTEGLSFHINQPLPFRGALEREVDPILAACRPLICRPDITAVVAANDPMALNLFAALRAAEIEPQRWPAVIGFDNISAASQYLLTSFSLPWDELGRTAADLLWQRRHGRLEGPPVHRSIPMRLIRRMTSQAGWSLMESARAVTELPTEAVVALPAERVPTEEPGIHPI